MGSGLLHPNSERYQWQTVTIRRHFFYGGAVSKEMKSVQEMFICITATVYGSSPFTASPLYDHPLSRLNVHVPCIPNAL